MTIPVWVVITFIAIAIWAVIMFYRLGYRSGYSIAVVVEGKFWCGEITKLLAEVSKVSKL